MPSYKTPQGITVKLVKTESEEGHPYYIYHLLVDNVKDDDLAKQIPVADFRRMGGGVGLEKWYLQKRGERKILSAYLWISAMGHDLDQWRHYDFETGQDVTNEFKELRLR